MKTIVLNTLRGAVSEYDAHAFQSITPTHAGRHDGVYRLEGNTDEGAPIAATIESGKRLLGSTYKKHIEAVYFALKGGGQGELLLKGPSTQYAYPFPVRASGESRAVPGKGFRENYVSFGYKNLEGADFQLDVMEIMNVNSKQRRL